MGTSILSGLSGLIGGLSGSTTGTTNALGNLAGQATAATGDPFNTSDALSVTGATDPNTLFTGGQLGPQSSLTDSTQQPPPQQVQDPSQQIPQSESIPNVGDQSQQPPAPPQQQQDDDQKRQDAGLPPAGPMGFTQNAQTAGQMGGTAQGAPPTPQSTGMQPMSLAQVANAASRATTIPGYLRPQLAQPAQFPQPPPAPPPPVPAGAYTDPGAPQLPSTPQPTGISSVQPDSTFADEAAADALSGGMQPGPSGEAVDEALERMQPGASGAPGTAPVATAPVQGPAATAEKAEPASPQAKRAAADVYPSQQGAVTGQPAGGGGGGQQGGQRGQQQQNPLAQLLHSKGGQAMLGLLIGGLLTQLFGGRRGGGGGPRFGGGWGRRGVSPGFSNYARAVPPGAVRPGGGWNAFTHPNYGNQGGMNPLAMMAMASMMGGEDQQGQGAGGQPGGQGGPDTGPGGPDSNPPTGPGGPTELGTDPNATPPQTAGPGAPGVDHTGVPTTPEGKPQGGEFILNPDYDRNNPQSPMYIRDPTKAGPQAAPAQAPSPQAARGNVQQAGMRGAVQTAGDVIPASLTEGDQMQPGAAAAAVRQGFDRATGATDPNVRQGPDGSQFPTNGMPGGTTVNAPPPTAGYGAIPNQQNRPKWYRGKLDAFGEKWDFGSGGGQFASLPFGTYHLFPGAVGSVGQRIGAAAGISDSNNPGDNTVHDPLYRGGGGTHARAGVELHPDVSGQLRTNGCIAIPRSQWGRFDQKFRAAASQGGLTLTVGPQGASIQSANAPRTPVPGYQSNMSALPGARWSQADMVDRRGSNAPGMTRGDRNNNPGNIKQGVDSQIYGATGYDREGHAIFPNWGAGRRAQASLLQRLYNFRTVPQIGREYANDRGWAAGVMRNGGFGSNEILNLNNPDTLDRLQRAIWKQEGTHPPAQQQAPPQRPAQPDLTRSGFQMSSNALPTPEMLRRLEAQGRMPGHRRAPGRIEPGDIRDRRREYPPGTEYSPYIPGGGIRGDVDASQTQV